MTFTLGRLTFSLTAVGERRIVWPNFAVTQYSPNSTWLVTSRLDTTRHVRRVESTCRVHAFWLCRACRIARLDTLVSTSSTRPTRSTRRAWQGRHVRRVEPMRFCGAELSTRSSRRARTCRVVLTREVTSQVEFGLMRVSTDSSAACTSSSTGIVIPPPSASTSPTSWVTTTSQASISTAAVSVLSTNLMTFDRVRRTRSWGPHRAL